jgi:hypothetical protein
MDKQKGKGVWKLVITRKSGEIEEHVLENLTTNVGRDYMINGAFNGGTVGSSWYIGLMDGTGFTGGAVGDTMSSHSGWTENVAYSQSNRVAWTQGSSSSGVITNASPAVFSINANGTLAGAFITNSNTKSGTSGTLWNTVAYVSGLLTVSNGDTVNITYTYALT